MTDMEQVRVLARCILHDPAYRESLLARARQGTLPPDIELLFLECFTLLESPAPLPPQSQTLALVHAPNEVPRD